MKDTNMIDTTIIEKWQIERESLRVICQNLKIKFKLDFFTVIKVFSAYKPDGFFKSFLVKYTIKSSQF